ncbi:MAG TPA: hypothetical protein VKE69_13540 [Planctomycetota bacterium]|nr:hypothetical protein [Planctomycetota bacterium]
MTSPATSLATLLLTGLAVCAVSPTSAPSARSVPPAIAPAAVPVSAQNAAAPEGDVQAISAATLSVDGDIGISIDQIANLLSSDAYLASLRKALRPDRGDDVTDEAFVSAEAVGTELLSVRIRSRRADVARAGLEAILDNLPKLEPVRAASAKRTAEIAAAEVERRAKELVRAREAMEKFVDANGPYGGGSGASEQFLEHAAERQRDLDDTRGELETRRSLRDFLNTRIAAEPPMVETRHREASARRRLLESQIEAVARMTPPAEIAGQERPLAEFLERQTRWIESIEKQLASAPLADREVVSSEPNERRVDLERELFEIDRQIAESEARQVQLAKACEALRVEATRLWKLRASWEELERATQIAAESAEEAVQRARSAAEEARPYRDQPWIRVVVGPRFD